MSWFVCFLLLPLPMPIMHRHDTIDAPQALSSHLAQRHCDASFKETPLDQSHWHFVLPSQSQPDEKHDCSLPSRPVDYVSSNAGSLACGPTAQFLPLDCLSTLGILSLDLIVDSPHPILDARHRFAADADQHHRCTLCCVMRC